MGEKQYSVGCEWDGRRGITERVVVQLLSHVQLFATPWAAALQASLSFTISQSLLKLMSIELVMPSNGLVLCCLSPSLLAFYLSQPQVFSRVFSVKSY